MAKRKNPRQIIHAGPLIGKALAPKELALLIALVRAAQETAGETAKTLSLTHAKLRRALDWKALNTKPRSA
jgi:hypothetical protein